MSEVLKYILNKPINTHIQTNSIIKNVQTPYFTINIQVINWIIFPFKINLVDDLSRQLLDTFNISVKTPWIV